MVLLAYVPVFSQDNFPEPFEIKADTAVYITLPPHMWQYMVTGQQKVPYPAVSSKKYAAAFKPGPDNNRGVAIITAQNLWVRYSVVNRLNRPVDITFQEYTARQDLYVTTAAGVTNHYHTGSKVPYSRRDGLKRLLEIPYTLQPGQVITVYEHSQDVKGNLTMSLGIEKNVLRHFVEDDEYVFSLIMASVMFGIFIIAFFFNAFFYYVVRERVYLMYGITLLCAAITYFQLPLTVYFFKEHPQYIKVANYISSALLLQLFVFTILMFLKTAQHHPLIHKIMVAVNSANIILSFYFFWTGANTTGILGLALWCLIIASLAGLSVILVADLIKRRHMAQLFIIGVMPFLVLFVYTMVYSGQRVAAQAAINATLVWAVVVISWSLFNRFKHLQEENARVALDKERLAREKEEERNELIARQNEALEHQVAARTAQLQQSLEDLRQTQNQLIQSEKMAGLGELTAGIAHEIQNPLNFVNNFSDVSIELLAEMSDELDNGDTAEAKAIAVDIKQNLEKIAHHGRRADGIVKGMLQHSRASSGQKEPTDINALADEYLRLAYHGLRAKDKSFNAHLVTNFSPNLPHVTIVPQDVGRVLLNLFTNAFYATQQKGNQMEDGTYKPVVELSTRQEGNIIEITVKDNGTGIPDAIKDKILQPFFTTKPTGQGTGLGLSLSYDIIVKGHGGKINIVSTEGEGAAFIITLPL